MRRPLSVSQKDRGRLRDREAKIWILTLLVAPVAVYLVARDWRQFLDRRRRARTVGELKSVRWQMVCYLAGLCLPVDIFLYAKASVDNVSPTEIAVTAWAFVGIFSVIVLSNAASTYYLERAGREEVSRGKVPRS